MLYSTVPGPSSGRLGPFVGDVFQDIRPDDKRSEPLLLLVLLPLLLLPLMLLVQIPLALLSC